MLLPTCIQMYAITMLFFQLSVVYSYEVSVFIEGQNNPSICNKLSEFNGRPSIGCHIFYLLRLAICFRLACISILQNLLLIGPLNIILDPHTILLHGLDNISDELRPGQMLIAINIDFFE